MPQQISTISKFRTWRVSLTTLPEPRTVRAAHDEDISANNTIIGINNFFIIFLLTHFDFYCDQDIIPVDFLPIHKLTNGNPGYEKWHSKSMLVIVGINIYAP